MELICYLKKKRRIKQNYKWKKKDKKLKEKIIIKNWEDYFQKLREDHYQKLRKRWLLWKIQKDMIIIKK